MVGSDRFTKGRYAEAAEMFEELTTNDHFVDFLTLPGYERLK
jgi:malate synthase